MGTIKSSNLQRISKSIRLGLFILAFFVGQNVQNASAKSLSTDATPISEDPSELPPQTSSKPVPTSLPTPDEDELDELKTRSKLITLNANSKPIQFKVSKSSLDNNFRIAVHLLNDCKFSDEENIQIYSKGRNFTWTCEDNSDSDSGKYGWREYSVPFSQDNLEEVLITPHFHSSNAKASISINIYKDSNDGCPRDYFDCNQDPCPTKCCSQYSDKSSRCIHMTLWRNRVPNCGRQNNNDESPKVWEPEKYCTCQAICLSWNYILTSLAIAVLFIITPTAIVFALFHRRNVALERERMIRLAEARMGEFTRDSPANDLPPSYDDVYDTKLPPPCFCQAVSLEDEENGSENDKCVCKNEKKEEDNSVESSLEVGEDVVNTVNNNERSEKNDRS